MSKFTSVEANMGTGKGTFISIITYEDFVHQQRYNLTQVARLLKVSRSTVRSWGKRDVEVMVIKKDTGYVPFVSYEKLGKRK